MDKYYYEFEQDSIYCYPDSFILKNKLNIREQDVLEEAERNITALRILELKEKPFKGVLNFKYLQKLHKYIFGDIYSWAGKLRSVNITKGNMFCDCKFIVQMADEIFEQLKHENYLKMCSEEDMPERLAYYLSEINALHSFREGNGRTQRLFIEILAENAGYEVDFSNVSAEEMIEASAESFIRQYEKMNLLMKYIVNKIE
ncbi:MAG TPA: Fic family protein [Candidatus Pelethocola excrementipullorum]|nr:Fic family protein [Candidatus Pelethocola excrementipullorum]